MFNQNFRLTQSVRIRTGVIIIVLIALMHIFRIGSYLTGNLYSLYYSYASDIIMPFGIYFLLCINQLYIKFLQKWYVKAAILIGLTSLVELLQFFGIYALGITFDPVDILAYIAGVGLAVFFDRLVLSKLMKTWDLEE